MAASSSPVDTESRAGAPVAGIGGGTEDEAETVAGGSQWNPLTAAALVGGAMAATAGAYLGAKAIARRNAGKDGRINSVLCTAITAGDMAAQKNPE
ncbi:MAG: hypothetical protein M3N39_14050 [Pseudomonadota bacterium]|nr:hypothetical protein [Pseudomonadota bacterium]